MTSKAEATFVCKSFGSNLLPAEAPQVGVVTNLKKKNGDALFTLTFNDATLRDPKSGKGAVLSVEKPLGGEPAGGGGSMRQSAVMVRADSGCAACIRPMPCPCAAPLCLPRPGTPIPCAA